MSSRRQCHQSGILLHFTMQEARRYAGRERRLSVRRQFPFHGQAIAAIIVRAPNDRVRANNRLWLLWHIKPHCQELPGIEDGQRFARRVAKIQRNDFGAEELSAANNERAVVMPPSHWTARTPQEALDLIRLRGQLTTSVDTTS